MLWFSVSTGVTPQAIEAGVTFYLIGALVGLFNRLYAEFGVDVGAQSRATVGVQIDVSVDHY